MVIIGITISFAISKYQENSTNDKLARIYLEGLKDDITSDIQSLSDAIQQTDSILASARSLIEAKDPSIKLAKERFVKHVRTIIRRPIFFSKNATFSSLKTSVNFQLIRDIELKNLLFEYDQNCQAIKAMESAELQATVAIVAPYILKSIPLTDSQQSGSLGALDTRSILSSVEFTNNIVLRLDNRTELVKSYHDTLRIAQKIQALIQKNL